MKIEIASTAGFCYGVKNAVKIAYSAVGKSVTLGEIIHNDRVVTELSQRGVSAVDSVDEIPSDTENVIIRSHGVGKAVYERLQAMGKNIIDATCPFVKKIHKIVAEYYDKNYQIVIFGEKNHAEVQGINGYCDNKALIIDNETDLQTIFDIEKVCIVSQTTFSIDKFQKFIEKVEKQRDKTVVIFDTICYTTNERQKQAKELASKSDAVIVIGSKKSSNTLKLYDICSSFCEKTFLIENTAQINIKNFCSSYKIGIVAGASTPTELIMEVKNYMSQQFPEVQNEEFINAVNDTLFNYKVGKRVKGKVIRADEKGIYVQIGGKKDALIPANEAVLDDNYNPADFVPEMEIEAIITNKNDTESNCVLLSKKKIDKIKEGNKFVEGIRNGEEFSFTFDREVKNGLIGSIGTYTLFVHASQIKEGFVKELKSFLGKKMRLIATEIDDEKMKIVASQRRILEKERKEKEEIFWTHIQPNVVVSGIVKRTTPFGAFVSVDGFDCLAHIADLSWNKVKTVEDVLTINQEYEFVVLSVDKEKNRVSLGYKQLQPHPFTSAMERFPIGSKHMGKVVRIMPFGAFVELEPGIDGLVHVSETAHNFVKNINDVVKVDDMVEVMILNIDESTRKITLSMKACTEAPEREENSRDDRDNSRSNSNNSYSNSKPYAKKSKPKNDSEDDKEWNEDSSNNPFADLLKNLDIKE